MPRIILSPVYRGRNGAQRREVLHRSTVRRRQSWSQNQAAGAEGAPCPILPILPASPGALEQRLSDRSHIIQRFGFESPCPRKHPIRCFPSVQPARGVAVLVARKPTEEHNYDNSMRLALPPDSACVSPTQFCQPAWVPVPPWQLLAP